MGKSVLVEKKPKRGKATIPSKTLTSAQEPGQNLGRSKAVVRDRIEWTLDGPNGSVVSFIAKQRKEEINKFDISYEEWKMIDGILTRTSSRRCVRSRRRVPHIYQTMTALGLAFILQQTTHLPLAANG